MQALRQKLIDLLEPVIEDAGYELIELEYTRERNWVVRLYVDRPNLPIIPGQGVTPGQGITLDECAQLSHRLSALLDVEDVIPHAYALEISSPGLRRPLRKLSDFQKFQGAQIRVRTTEPLFFPEDTTTVGRRNFLGRLLPGNDPQWMTIEVDGLLLPIPYNMIDRANLEPDFDQLMAAHQSSNQPGEF